MLMLVLVLVVSASASAAPVLHASAAGTCQRVCVGVSVQLFMPVCVSVSSVV